MAGKNGTGDHRLENRMQSKALNHVRRKQFLSTWVKSPRSDRNASKILSSRFFRNCVDIIEELDSVLYCPAILVVEGQNEVSAIRFLQHPCQFSVSPDARVKD